MARHIKPSGLFLLSFLLFLQPPFESLSQPQIRESSPASRKPGDDGVHLSTPTRQKIDLNGSWLYSFDEEMWADVSVPSSFDREGRIAFQRRFTIDEQQMEEFHFKLVALGINHEAEILINDVFVGRHTGGYTSFEYDIPENILQFGPENTIKVIVNNVLSVSSTLPVRKQVWGWRNYGGILRDIYLLAVPTMWIGKLDLQTEYQVAQKVGTIDFSATISTAQSEEPSDTTLAKSTTTYALQFELYDQLTNALVGTTTPQPIMPLPQQDVEVRSILTVNNPKAWSPDAPDLYLLRASLVSLDGKKKNLIDEYTRIVGFRAVTISGDQIQLNGKRLTLKGVVWHEDSPDHGASLSYPEMERDIVLMKTLGANAVRFAFHPPHPYLLSLCGRYGLFALLEIPVWNVPAQVLASEQFQIQAETVAREMVRRDQHYPSVLAWGIGTEFDSADQRGREYVRRLSAFVKSLDRRPVYFASRMMKNESAVDLVDFAAIVVSPTDVKSFKLALSDWKKQNAGKPILILRYGKTVEHENRNGYSDPMSQEAQARYFLQHYDAIRQVGVAGSFVGSFADWLGDRPLLTVNASNSYLHPTGIVSASREKRLAYDVVKTLYADQKVAALPIGSYRASLPVPHVVVGFAIIFALAYQYNYNRRFREAIKRSLLRPYNFFADLRDQRATSVAHTLMLSLGISMTLAVVLSSLLYHFRTDLFADVILTQLVVSDQLKEEIIAIAWNPMEGIAILTVFFVGLCFLVTVVIRISAMFVKARISFFHAFSVAVWCAVPFIFLSPLGMSFFKILENPLYVVPSFVVLTLFAVWVLMRLFRGVSVIYDVSAARTYAGGLLIVVAVVGGGLLLYDASYALFAYAEFILNIARSAV